MHLVSWKEKEGPDATIKLQKISITITLAVEIFILEIYERY